MRIIFILLFKPYKSECKFRYNIVQFNNGKYLQMLIYPKLSLIINIYNIGVFQIVWEIKIILPNLKIKEVGCQIE